MNKEGRRGGDRQEVKSIPYHKSILSFWLPEVYFHQNESPASWCNHYHSFNRILFLKILFRFQKHTIIFYKIIFLIFLVCCSINVEYNVNISFQFICLKSALPLTHVTIFSWNVQFLQRMREESWVDNKKKLFRHQNKFLYRYFEI